MTRITGKIRKSDTSNVWRCARGPIETGRPFGVMGILNVTPDSFYDGGQNNTKETTFRRAERLLKEGADIIDIGGESTRPGSKAVSAAEEAARLFPLVKELRSILANVFLSVDTRKPEIAKQAILAGADIINDVSGCRQPGMLDILADYKPGYVLMYAGECSEGSAIVPAKGKIIDRIKEFFERSLAILISAGLPEENVILDPGIGFGKTFAQNLEILNCADQFLIFGRPLLIGLSMKSMWGMLLGLDVDKREIPTAVATALAWQRGIFWHRVHHPANATQSLIVAAAFSNTCEGL